MIFRGQKKNKERGANLVEFAILMPLLMLLILGTVEFAWLFSQNLDVRHGAREGARLAAVNHPVGPTDGTLPRNNTDRDNLVADICARMDTPTGAEITINSTNGEVGDPATVTVDAPGNTLTGFIDWAIPSGLRLESTVEIRIEQPATWSNGAALPCP